MELKLVSAAGLAADPLKDPANKMDTIYLVRMLPAESLVRMMMHLPDPQGIGDDEVVETDAVDQASGDVYRIFWQSRVAGARGQRMWFLYQVAKG